VSLSTPRSAMPVVYGDSRGIGRPWPLDAIPMQQGHLGAGRLMTQISARPLLGRVASAVYWRGRYLERAENVARVVDVNIRLADEIIVGGLHEFLDDMQARLNRVDDAVVATVFAMRDVDSNMPRQRQA